MMLLPEKYRYIVVEGPIGAGKTSLARMLAERSGSAALLEDPDANPFLPGFYQDSARYALPAQLFFLFQRLNQVIIAYHAAAHGDVRLSPELAEYRLFKPQDVKCWRAGTGYALADWLRAQGHQPQFIDMARRP